MKKALTLINGKYRYVDLTEAIERGRCYFCGKRFRKHPKRHGQVLLNRHHRIKVVFSEIYEEVTGQPYPDVCHNLFWAAVGCHAEFHDDVDPWPKPWERDPIQPLHNLLKIFLQIMRQCNFGEKCLRHPAPMKPSKTYYPVLG